MKLKISYHHLDSSPSIDEKIRAKAEHLKKYFSGESEISWVCSVENHRHKSEVNAHAGHFHFHASAEADNLYKTLDDVIHKIEVQMSKKDNQLKDKIHRKHKEKKYEGHGMC